MIAKCVQIFSLRLVSPLAGENLRLTGYISGLVPTRQGWLTGRRRTFTSSSWPRLPGLTSGQGLVQVADMLDPEPLTLASLGRLPAEHLGEGEPHLPQTLIKTT